MSSETHWSKNIYNALTLSERESCEREVRENLHEIINKIHYIFKKDGYEEKFKEIMDVDGSIREIREMANGNKEIIDKYWFV